MIINLGYAVILPFDESLKTCGINLIRLSIVWNISNLFLGYRQPPYTRKRVISKQESEEEVHTIRSERLEIDNFREPTILIVLIKPICYILGEFSKFR